MEGGINLQDLRKCLHWCNVPYSAYICDECPYREHGLYACVEQAMRDADKLLEKLEPILLNKTPGVDAIPVEWLKEHDDADIRDSDGNSYGRRKITVVEALSMWQKEQEARQ